MAIKTIGVIGAGQMGNGICQVAAYPGGINVIMNDIAEQFVNKGFDTISKNLDRLVAKDKIKADQKTEILSRIKKSTNLEDMKAADIVVEAATEREDLKLGHLQEARRGLQARRDPRVEHLVDPHHADRRRHEAPRARHRHALHEPRPGHAARRDHQRVSSPPRKPTTPSRPSRSSSARPPSSATTSRASSPTASSCP